MAGRRGLWAEERFRIKWMEVCSDSERIVMKKLRISGRRGIRKPVGGLERTLYVVWESNFEVWCHMMRGFEQLHPHWGCLALVFCMTWLWQRLHWGTTLGGCRSSSLTIQKYSFVILKIYLLFFGFGARSIRKIIKKRISRAHHRVHLYL